MMSFERNITCPLNGSREALSTKFPTGITLTIYSKKKKMVKKCFYIYRLTDDHEGKKPNVKSVFSGPRFLVTICTSNGGKRACFFFFGLFFFFRVNKFMFV